MMRLALLSIVVGLMTMFGVKDPQSMDIEKFGLLSKFLNVFVAFLLGFFMSSAVQRWTACMTAFMILCEHVRSIQIQLHALGVSRERTSLVFRYCTVACDLLSYCLRIDGLLAAEHKKDKNEEKQRL